MIVMLKPRCLGPSTLAIPSVALNEYTKEEWLDIVRVLKPHISGEEYDRLWAEFCLAKQFKEMQ